MADPGHWRLHNVLVTHFTDDKVTSEVVPEMTMTSAVNPDFLGLAATDPDLLTLRGLWSYIDHLRRNNLGTASYEIGFWSRIARLFAVIVVSPPGAAVRVRAAAHHRCRHAYRDRRDARGSFSSSSTVPSRTAVSCSA